MASDDHEHFRRMVDEMLAGSIPASQERLLQEHLQSCVPCQDFSA